MSENEYLEAILLKYFFHIENEKIKAFEEEDAEEES